MKKGRFNFKNGFIMRIIAFTMLLALGFVIICLGAWGYRTYFLNQIVASQMVAIDRWMKHSATQQWLVIDPHVESTPGWRTHQFKWLGVWGDRAQGEGALSPLALTLWMDFGSSPFNKKADHLVLDLHQKEALLLRCLIKPQKRQAEIECDGGEQTLEIQHEMPVRLAISDFNQTAWFFYEANQFTGQGHLPSLTFSLPDQYDVQFESVALDYEVNFKTLPNGLQGIDQWLSNPVSSWSLSADIDKTTLAALNMLPDNQVIELSLHETDLQVQRVFEQGVDNLSDFLLSLEISQMMPEFGCSQQARVQYEANNIEVQAVHFFSQHLKAVYEDSQLGASGAQVATKAFLSAFLPHGPSLKLHWQLSNDVALMTKGALDYHFVPTAMTDLFAQDTLLHNSRLNVAMMFSHLFLSCPENQVIAQAFQQMQSVGLFKEDAELNQKMRLVFNGQVADLNEQDVTSYLINFYQLLKVLLR